VLRGVTCTNFVYPTRALFGAVPPQRHVVSQHGLLPNKIVVRYGTVTMLLSRIIQQEQYHLSATW
jgi:hypothetical protein